MKKLLTVLLFSFIMLTFASCREEVFREEVFREEISRTEYTVESVDYTPAKYMMQYNPATKTMQNRSMSASSCECILSNDDGELTFDDNTTYDILKDHEGDIVYVVVYEITYDDSSIKQIREVELK